MTHRERFYTVISHKPADRAVFDLAGSPQTMVDYDVAKDKLAELLGIGRNRTAITLMNVSWKRLTSTRAKSAECRHARPNIAAKRTA